MFIQIILALIWMFTIYACTPWGIKTATYITNFVWRISNWYKVNLKKVQNS